MLTLQTIQVPIEALPDILRRHKDAERGVVGKEQEFGRVGRKDTMRLEGIDLFDNHLLRCLTGNRGVRSAEVDCEFVGHAGWLDGEDTGQDLEVERSVRSDVGVEFGVVDAGMLEDCGVVAPSSELAED